MDNPATDPAAGEEDTLAADPRALEEQPAPERTRLGRYALLDVIGRGGMGEVWAAYDPDLDRRVAIKVLHGAVAATEEARTRIIREARAMARLSHPNVVAIHDVGLADGEVFIAMEHVGGGTLRSWLDAEPPLDELVAMFVQAGRGLAAAHEQGLVHRDFKPGNVLVGDDGRPRVADFGLVRSTADAEPPTDDDSSELDLDEATGALTRTGAVLGTPAYMSPEQWLGKVPTEASDQFSFCVALWKALCGEAPFAGKTIGALSDAVTSGQRRPFSRERGVPPRHVAALERGLSVEPTDRHPSMSALLDALEGQAKRTWVRAGIAGAAIASVAWLAIGREAGPEPAPEPCAGAIEALVGTWDDDARGSLRTTIEARARVDGAAAADVAVASLDAYAEAWVDAHVDACRATRVHGQQTEAMLDKRMACMERRRRRLDTFVKSFAEVEPARLPGAIGAIERLPSMDGCAAVDELTEAESLPTDPQAREIVDAAQVVVDEAGGLDTAGRPSEALERIEAAGIDPATIEHGSTRAELLLLHAELLEELGNADDALARGEAALIAAREAGAVRLSAMAELGLASTAHVASKLEEGHRWVALARADARHLGDQRIAALAARREGQLFHRAGEFAKALEAADRELALLRATNAGPLSLASAEGMRANLLVRLGRVDDALVVFEEVLQGRRDALWPGHPGIATVLNNRAIALQESGRPQDAVVDLRQALQIREAAYGHDHPWVTDTLVNLGNALREADQVDEALEVMAEALRLRKGQVGPDHPRWAITHNDYAVTLLAADRYEDAKVAYEAARRGFEQALGEDSHMIAYALAGLAEVAFHQGDFAEALRLDQRALDLRIGAFGEEHPLVEESRNAVSDDRDALTKAELEAG